jgi:YihY family inner membrane protein
MFSIVPSNSDTPKPDAAAADLRIGSKSSENAEAATATKALTDKSSTAIEKEDGKRPIEEVEPVVRQEGTSAGFVALIRYLARTDVHTYAFSVAANAILSLFPFIVLLLTLTRGVFHSRSMEQVVGEMMKSFLPTGQDFVMRNMQLLAHPRKGTQIFSLFMLLVTSTGVFLPLEVALNNVWGVTKNRSYIRNQMVSLGLAFGVGVLAMISVFFTSNARFILTWIFFGHTENAFFSLASFWFMKACALVTGILVFFLIYWVLPNRKVSARAVLPTAIVVGLFWELAKLVYIWSLPWLDFQGVYGPFYISVGLMMWAFFSGLLLLAGAHFSATRYTIKLAREAELEEKHGTN